MSTPRFFLWADLETTGSSKTEDYTLEIALVLTEIKSPCRELAAYEAVVRPDDPDWRNRLTEFVIQMHTMNGLLDDVEAHGRSRREVEHEILALLMTHGRPHDFMLAGSAVSHYDNRFIEREFPGLRKWLQHPFHDVGFFRRALRFCDREDLECFGHTFEHGEKPHRGMGDIRDHLNEWREYASMIESIPKETR